MAYIFKALSIIEVHKIFFLDFLFIFFFFFGGGGYGGYNLPHVNNLDFSENMSDLWFLHTTENN